MITHYHDHPLLFIYLITLNLIFIVILLGINFKVVREMG